jgi:hypothetical protein
LNLSFDAYVRLSLQVINAIAKSRVDPERAERIVDGMERRYEAGDKDVQPDAACYGALINAFGWSDCKGRALKCNSIYQKMLELHKTRRNVIAKPDIVTCNSLLNACTYDTATTKQEKAAIMEIVVKTLENVERKAPKLGWPDHLTYAHVLRAIENHVVEGAHRRTELAESVFWECCRRGLVSVPVVTSLYRVLPWERFSDILDCAVHSGQGEPLRFNWKLLPIEWTRYAPRPNQHQESRPSSKPRRVRDRVSYH